MRKATGIIIGIFLGALAAGVSVGFFLYKANMDRELLAKKLTETTQTAREQNQQAVQEANDKLQNANNEINKAQTLLQALQEERAIISKSEPLISRSDHKTWLDIISLDQGVSFKVPKGNTVVANDKQALIIEKDLTSSQNDARWLSITPYDLTLEKNFLKTFSDVSEVIYMIDGRALDGYRGKNADDNKMTLLLRVRYGGELTHLIWARSEYSTKIDDLTEILSTLHFQ